MPTSTRFPDRDAIIKYLHTHLIGPVEGPTEIVEDKPHQRYLTGLLYPQSPSGPSTESSDADEDGEIKDEAPGQLLDDDDEDPITLSGQTRPSSAGISFVTTAWSVIEVELHLGRYEQVDSREWRRSQIEFAGPSALRLSPRTPGAKCIAKIDLLDDAASVEVRWRPHGQGAVVTVVLVNQRKQGEGQGVDSVDCLFQVELRCRPADGTITRYPGRRHLTQDDEAVELDLLYRNVPVFALGHGSAAEWDEVTGDHAEWVRTSFLPVHVVPGVSFEVDGPNEVLQLDRLAGIERSPERTLQELTEFVDRYQSWVDEIRDSVRDSLRADLAAAADRLMKRAETALERMRRGIKVLRDDRWAKRAFALANRAMLMQMVHGSTTLAGEPHAPSSAPTIDIRYDSPEYTWRPFQLGFLLLTIESVVTDGPDRDLVDLIWFPTGGGKTEAYLGLAAFTILHRRLTKGDEGAGTTVITRYTLRLLTAQQFQRAATMIAACEMLRRNHRDELGSVPISIGMWVGANNTPNSYGEAQRILAEMLDGAMPDQSFQIETCPWCGTKIVPTGPEDDQVWGIKATNNTFKVFCLNDNCPFQQSLPVSSVDEDLYQNPPTMLVGTVDKFARAVWEPQTGVFFGTGDTPGPSLIIQDEFHLISGPLGTLVGLYEAAFDVLMNRTGARPKIVAATATIRKADDQTRGVFGRKVALFPPAGVDAADSYFVRMVDEGPGRAYVGVMPQGHTPLTALVHLTAAQLQATKEEQLAPDTLDAYSTLVVYHNSLRELGKTINLAQDDIPERIKIIARAEDDIRVLDDDNTLELTSNVPSSSIPQRLERLGRPFDAPRGVALLASTNMLSVGVDVSRLGTMTVVGQPKTTAEYIQATSRVGRSIKRPGLVVTLYSPSKPRDRSHYESFVPYHSTLYSSVEPSSVTPFSVAARTRALHSDLVLLVRHALGLRDDKDAARFDKSDRALHELIEQFLERAERADPTEVRRVREHMDRLVRSWTQQVDDADPIGGLHYRGRGRAQPRLLLRFNETGDGWRTLDSMRSVDVDVQVRVRGVRT
jgi:hypothetical protein